MAAGGPCLPRNHTVDFCRIPYVSAMGINVQRALTDIDHERIFIMAEKEQHRVSYDFVEGPAAFDLAALVYVESRLHRCLFHFRNGTTLSTYRKLDDVEKLLADERMLRIHKSYLINVTYCIKVSNYSLWLQDGQIFSVPRARYHYVKECYIKYCLEKGREA